MKALDLFSCIGCHAIGFHRAGDWNPDQLAALRVDARGAGEMDRSRSAVRRERIEALGDSNPPHMAEAIGRAIITANT